MTPESPLAPVDGDDDGETSERKYQVEVNGRLFGVKVIGEAGAIGSGGGGGGSGLKRPPKRDRAAGGSSSGATEDLIAPLQGSIFKLPVEKGAEVEEGDIICVIEAMKMENEITAHRTGKLTELAVSEGDAVNAGDLLAKIE